MSLGGTRVVCAGTVEIAKGFWVFLDPSQQESSLASADVTKNATVERTKTLLLPSFKLTGNMFAIKRDIIVLYYSKPKSYNQKHGSIIDLFPPVWTLRIDCTGQEDMGYPCMG